MGYRFPKETIDRLLAEDRVLFGEDEDQIVELKVYAQEYEAKLPSVIEIDGRSGANDLSNLFGEAQRFKNPKAAALLQGLIPFAAGKGDTMLDFFAGSGTTAHAVMRLNAKAGLGLTWVCVEASRNLEAMILPRVKKAAFCLDWQKGRPGSSEGPGAFVRVQTFEQYEDTLESLDTDPDEGDSADLPFDDPALALRYRLDRASRRLYRDVERFASPSGYRLKAGTWIPLRSIQATTYDIDSRDRASGDGRQPELGNRNSHHRGHPDMRNRREINSADHQHVFRNPDSDVFRGQ
jgi:adenine-specific DNA-methyltransferase